MSAQRRRISGKLRAIARGTTLTKTHENLITNSIAPHKDVDGFTSVSLGHLFSGHGIIAPATARAVIHLIESTGIKIEGKNAVVVGRSNIVGKPVAMMLLEKNATVTVCHS